MTIPSLLDSISNKTLNKLLLIGLPVVVFALLIMGRETAHRSQALEMRQRLATLTARDVARVIIIPSDTASASETRPPTTVVTAPIAIQKLLAAYGQAGSYGPGGGRLSGWQARADFHLRTGQVIYSTVYQNDYTSLLFIVADSTTGLGSPADCLMSQTAGHLIQTLSRAPR